MQIIIYPGLDVHGDLVDASNGMLLKYAVSLGLTGGDFSSLISPIIYIAWLLHKNEILIFLGRLNANIFFSLYS